MWKPKTIDLDKPFYISIADAMENDVRKGVLAPGQKMPPHRKLADIIGVNVSTVSRAYREAERRGLVTGTVGRGTYVAGDGGESGFMDPQARSGKIIDMSHVLPLYECEPDLSILAEKVLSKKNISKYAAYADPAGFPEHREIGAQWAGRAGISASVESTLVCAGAQHGIFCALSALFEPGDRIATDSLTYPGIKSAARTLGLRLEPVASDEGGMSEEDLERVCRRNHVKGLYLIPDLHNPTAAVMDQKKRKALAAVIEKENLLLIEDGTFSFVSHPREKALSALVPERSVYVAGLSKAFYGGLRVSFLQAPKEWRMRLAKAILETVWMAAPLGAALASECIQSGLADRIIADKLIENERRLVSAKKLLAGGSIKGVKGAPFLWLELPEPWNGRDFESEAKEKGVKIFGAEKFMVGGGTPPRAVRISLTAAGSFGEVEEGLGILGAMLEKGYVPLDSIL